MAYLRGLFQNQYQNMTLMDTKISLLQASIESCNTKLTNLTNSINNLMIGNDYAAAAGDHQAAFYEEPTASFRLPEINFPRFEGENPRAWTNKCDQFFELCPVHESKKVLFASFHLDARPEIWFRSYCELKQSVLDWPTFVEDICARFGHSRMDEFRRLKQSTTVMAYLEKFEELVAEVIWESWFEEDFLVACFLGGLKDEIKFRVQRLNPTTFSDAAYMARCEEAALRPSI